MLIYKNFVNSDTGEVVKTLPNLDCVEEVELKSYNKMEYHRKAKRNLRSLLFLEHRYSKNRGWFLTLTYDDRCLPPDDDNILKDNIQKFMKRLRIWHQRVLHINSKIKYVSVVEHGEEKGRLHHHLVMWNVSALAITYMCRSNSFGANIWNLGFVSAKPIDGQGINYVIKYVFKQQSGKFYKVLRSRNIGYYREKIRKLCFRSAKDGTFRSGRFFYRIPLYLLSRCFSRKSWKYQDILFRYHQKFCVYNPRDLVLDCIGVIGNVYSVIPRGLYNRYKYQIECNRYESEFK